MKQLYSTGTRPVKMGDEVLMCVGLQIYLLHVYMLLPLLFPESIGTFANEDSAGLQDP